MNKSIQRRDPDLTLAAFTNKLPKLLEKIYLARGVSEDSQLQQSLKAMKMYFQIN